MALGELPGADLRVRPQQRLPDLSREGRLFRARPSNSALRSFRQPCHHQVPPEPPALPGIPERMPLGELAGAEISVDAQQIKASQARLIDFANSREAGREYA